MTRKGEKKQRRRKVADARKGNNNSTGLSSHGNCSSSSPTKNPHTAIASGRWETGDDDTGYVEKGQSASESGTVMTEQGFQANSRSGEGDHDTVGMKRKGKKRPRVDRSPLPTSGMKVEQCSTHGDIDNSDGTIEFETDMVINGASERSSSTGGTGTRVKGNSAARGDEAPLKPGAQGLSELQQRMRQKLEGAQFRMINETLYTSDSKAALTKFQKEPALFDVYHRGFREQVEKWPVHPLDAIIQWLGKYPKARVADFGCGEARLAATVLNKVYSFDLVSPNPRVTACDMANVPLKDSSVHVAVFCLSLMGTNLADFLREAHRVLVPGGLMKVAEVRSRFEGEKDGVERFLEVTRRLGFDQRQLDRSNKMFLLAEFKKSGRPSEAGIEFEAKDRLPRQFSIKAAKLYSEVRG